MTSFYLECCTDLGWKVDQNLVNKMKSENELKLKVTYLLSYRYSFSAFITCAFL